MNTHGTSPWNVEMDRRSFARLLAAAGVGAGTLSLTSSCALFAEEPLLPPATIGPDSPYRRPNTDWLAKRRYGLGVHWTAQSMPRHGQPLPFQQAVEAFDLKTFVDQVRQAGAEYVLFTTCHAYQKWPGPNAIVDQIAPGRTCTRDLIKEMADALDKYDIPLLLYWNHGCNNDNVDPEWSKAVGYKVNASAAEWSACTDKLLEIIAWASRHYGKRVKAWWFDSPWALDPRGPYHPFHLEQHGFTFPWERLTAAAKTGYRDRLVSVNNGDRNQAFLFTKHQDFVSGEMYNFDRQTPPKSRYTSAGLQWFGWTCLDEQDWVHVDRDREVPAPRWPDKVLVDYVRAANAVQMPMTFNVGPYQNGHIAQASVDQLRRLGEQLKGRSAS